MEKQNKKSRILKLIGFLCIIVAVWGEKTGFSQSPTNLSGGTQTGDADGDQLCTELDALTALRMAAGIERPRSNMDVNKNGLVDTEDALLLIQRADRGERCESDAESRPGETGMANQQPTIVHQREIKLTDSELGSLLAGDRRLAEVTAWAKKQGYTLNGSGIRVKLSDDTTVLGLTAGPIEEGSSILHIRSAIKSNTFLVHAWEGQLVFADPEGRFEFILEPTDGDERMRLYVFDRNGEPVFIDEGEVDTGLVMDQASPPVFTDAAKKPCVTYPASATINCFGSDPLRWAASETGAYAIFCGGAIKATMALAPAGPVAWVPSIAVMAGLCGYLAWGTGSTVACLLAENVDLRSAPFDTPPKITPPTNWQVAGHTWIPYKNRVGEAGEVLVPIYHATISATDDHSPPPTIEPSLIKLSAGQCQVVSARDCGGHQISQKICAPPITEPMLKSWRRTAQIIEKDSLILVDVLAGEGGTRKFTPKGGYGEAETLTIGDGSASWSVSQSADSQPSWKISFDFESPPRVLKPGQTFGLKLKGTVSPQANVPGAGFDLRPSGLKLVSPYSSYGWCSMFVGRNGRGEVFEPQTITCQFEVPNKGEVRLMAFNGLSLTYVYRKPSAPGVPRVNLDRD